MASSFTPTAAWLWYEGGGGGVDAVGSQRPVIRGQRECDLAKSDRQQTSGHEIVELPPKRVDKEQTAF